MIVEVQKGDQIYEVEMPDDLPEVEASSRAQAFVRKHYGTPAPAALPEFMPHGPAAATRAKNAAIAQQASLPTGPEAVAALSTPLLKLREPLDQLLQGQVADEEARRAARGITGPAGKVGVVGKVGQAAVQGVASGLEGFTSPAGAAAGATLASLPAKAALAIGSALTLPALGDVGSKAAAGDAPAVMEKLAELATGVAAPVMAGKLGRTALTPSRQPATPQELVTQLQRLVTPKGAIDAINTGQITPEDLNLSWSGRPKTLADRPGLTGVVTPSTSKDARALAEDVYQRVQAIPDTPAERTLPDGTVEKTPWTQRQLAFQQQLAEGLGHDPTKKVAISKLVPARIAYGELESTFGPQAATTFSKYLYGAHESSNIQTTLGNAPELTAAIKTLKKRGLSPDEISYAAQYARSTPDRTAAEWDPSAVTSSKDNATLVPKFDPTHPLAQKIQPERDLPELAKIRQHLDRIHAEYAGDTPYLPGYVPIKSKLPLGTGTTAERVLNPAIWKRRTSASGSDPLFETNIEKLLTRYHKDVAREAAFTPLAPDLSKTLWQLRALGQDHVANSLEARSYDLMGVKDPKTIQRLEMDNLLKMTDPEIHQQLVAMDMRPSTAGAIYGAMKDAFANAAIFLNPMTQIANKLQPEQFAADLGGFMRTERARLSSNKVTGPLVDLAQPLRKEISADWKADAKYITRGDKSVIDTETPLDAYPKIKTALDIANLPAKPARAVFERSEAKNREIAYRAASQWYADAPEKAVARLTDFEKSMIADAKKAGGDRGARREFAKIAVMRSNFPYFFADAPEWLYHDFVRKQVPFTTFVRNAMGYALADFKKGPLKGTTLAAKRLAYPAALAFAARQLNEKLGAKLDPYSATDVARMGTPGTNPALQFVESSAKAARSPDKVFVLELLKNLAKQTATGKAVGALSDFFTPPSER